MQSLAMVMEINSVNRRTKDEGVLFSLGEKRTKKDLFNDKDLFLYIKFWIKPFLKGLRVWAAPKVCIGLKVDFRVVMVD